MKKIAEFIKLSHLLDRNNFGKYSNLIDEYILKDAKKGYHKCGLKEETVNNHTEIYDTYKEEFAQLKQEYEKALKSKSHSPNTGKLRNATKNIKYVSNAVYLHDLYMTDLINSKPFELKKTKVLFSEMKSRYINRDRFEDHLRSLAMVSRSGWVVLYYCLQTGELHLCPMDLHDTGGPVCKVAIMAVDMWEHAYINDFGIDKDAYIDWCLSRIDWRGVEKRFKKVMKIKLD